MMPWPGSAACLLIGGMLLCAAARWRRVRWLGTLELLTIAGAIGMAAAGPVVNTAEFRPDGLSQAWELLILGWAAVTLLLARDWRRQDGRLESAPGMAALCAGALIAAAYARDWLTLGLCLDALTIAGLRLIETNSLPAPRRLWPAWLGSLLFWWGALLLLNLLGTWDFAAARAVFVDSYAISTARPPVGSPSVLSSAAVVLMLAGVGLRMGVLPWSIWALDGGTEAPLWRGVAWLLGWQLAGIIVLQRLLAATLGGLEPMSLTVVIVCALAAGWGGAALAVAHDRLRAQLAGLAQVLWAWQLTGLAPVLAEEALAVHAVGMHLGQPGAMGWLLLLQFSSLATVLGLTCVWQSLQSSQRPVAHAADFAGWGELAPGRAALFGVFALALLGFWPTLAGWSRWGACLAGLSAVQDASEPAPHGGVRLLLLGMIVPTVVTGVVVCRWCRGLLFDPAMARPQRPAVSLATTTAAWLALLLLLGGLHPAPLLHWAVTAARTRPTPAVLPHGGRPGAEETLGWRNERIPGTLAAGAVDR